MYRGKFQEIYRPLVRLADKDGYWGVNPAGGPHRKVHHLVLETFIGPRPEGLWGLHKNDVNTDNDVDNLVWGLPKENTAMRIANGSPMHGIHNPAAKLTVDQVREIRAVPITRGYRKPLAAKYGVSEVLIKKIKSPNSELWKGVA